MTIGNFDGVHVGHARIVEQLIRRAQWAGGKAVVFTFDPHPARLLRPEAAPAPLTWIDRKMELLAKLGVHSMIAYPTDQALLQLTPKQFFRRIVVDALNAQAMVEGPNFFFGRDRAGDIDTLAALTSEAKIQLEIVEPIENDGDFVSSSRIRELIERGEVATARSMLTQPYRIRGMVTHGAGRGAKIGFPTANIDAIDTLLPGLGVYAGRAYVGGNAVPTAINIGSNPTFGDHVLKVEAHLIDFEGELYHQPLEVDFLEKLRDIQPFDSVEQLTAQLTVDVAAALAAAKRA